MAVPLKGIAVAQATAWVVQQGIALLDGFLTDGR
jgi:hypothetical protein